MSDDDEENIFETTPEIVSALRHSFARIGSRTERDYLDAIQAVRQGKPARLIHLLRARRPLNQDDFEALANYIEQTAKLTRGQPRKEHHREAADLAEFLLSLSNNPKYSSIPVIKNMTRDFAVEFACRSTAAVRRKPVDIDAVIEMMRRSTKRRT